MHSFKHHNHFLALLGVAYVLTYGWLLMAGNGLPYVMDNNESFSSFWHAYNLFHFGLDKSAGLADEAFAFHAAAHPYVHTHQGNFPRLFNFLIYMLGAHSIESQITVTTFTVGVAAIFMAYHFFCKIANPLFALVCCLLLITDYVLVAQWQVVTYRVWHEFFVFSSLLCVHRMADGRRYWVIATFINFLCLFYYELIFVVFVSLSSALYAAFLCRHSPKRALGFWAVQAVGGATALCVLAVQLYFYMGWSNLLQDAHLTFGARNDYTDSATLLERMHSFYESKNIIFWYNLEDGSKYRTIAYFVASLSYFELQVHTPLLSAMGMIALLALFVALFFPMALAIFKHDKAWWIDGVGGRISQLILSPELSGALALSIIYFLHKYRSHEFGDMQMVVFTAIVAIVTLAIVGVCFSARWDVSAFRSRVSQKAGRFTALAILICLVPSITTHTSKAGSLFGGYSSYFIAYCLIVGAFFFWILWGLLSNKPVTHDIPTNIRAKVVDKAGTFVLFISFLVFFLALLGKNLVFGIQDEARGWLVPASLTYLNVGLIAAAGATALLQYVCRFPGTGGQLDAAENNEPMLKFKVSVFVLLVALFIAQGWRIYNPRYAPLWLEMVESSLPSPLPYVLTILVTALGCMAMIARKSTFSEMGVTSVISNCGAFLLTGFIAYVVVYLLSPGYIFSGYRFRLVPFTAFHTVIFLALPLYLLLAVGLKYLKPWWRRKSGAASPEGPPVSQVSYVGLGMDAKAWVGVASLVALGLISVYWVGIQRSYIRLMPPDHYSFLSKLTKAPYVGRSFLVNTYAAPIAAKTGAWAYMHGDLNSNRRLTKVGDRYTIPFDGTYLWLADKNENPDYTRPDYFLCITIQSTSTVIDRVRKRHGLGEGAAGCEANQLVQLARAGDGKSVYPSVEFLEADAVGLDAVGFERWAIIKLNWEK